MIETNIPNDYEAEQAVLGSIIYDNESLNEVSFLTPASFYAPPHQYIFRAIIELSNQAKEIDEILIGNELKKIDELEEVGGYSYLTSLVDCVPSSGNVAQYAKIIHEKHQLRKLITATTDISKKSRVPEAMANELIIEVMKAVESIGETSIGNKYEKIKDLVHKRIQAYEKFTDKSVEKEWIPTGFNDLDKYILGLQKGDAIIIAGRPSMGKTALATNIITRSAMFHKYTGAIVIASYEMKNERLTDRMITTESKVNYNKLKRGEIGQSEFDKLYAAITQIQELPIVMIDKNSNLDSLKPELKAIEREYGSIELMIFDYMQLIPPSDPRAPREQQIAKISRTLKLFAGDFNCPVIALSQLNRELEKRTNKEPMLADLRESGAIEQDGDVIMFIYRDEVYNEKSPEKGTAKIIIAKQREGPIGDCYLKFTEKHTRFDNLEE